MRIRSICIFVLLLGSCHLTSSFAKEPSCNSNLLDCLNDLIIKVENLEQEKLNLKKEINALEKKVNENSRLVPINTAIRQDLVRDVDILKKGFLYTIVPKTKFHNDGNLDRICPPTFRNLGQIRFQSDTKFRHNFKAGNLSDPGSGGWDHWYGWFCKSLRAN